MWHTIEKNNVIKTIYGLPDRFPYRYSSVAPRWFYELFRAEGLPLELSIRGAHAYLLKYLFGATGGAKEAPDYFAKQNQISHLVRVSSEESTDGVKLGLVGDIMWIRNQWQSFLTHDLRSRLESMDAIIGNLETPIAQSFPVPEFFYDYFSYNSPPELLHAFHSGEKNLLTCVSLANNHIYDRGEKGAIETAELLHRLGIHYSGIRPQGHSPYVSFACKDFQIGFYAATFGLNQGLGVISETCAVNVLPGLAPQLLPHAAWAELEDALREMQFCDLKIVYLHWGHEFEDYPDALLMQVARRIVAMGADIVVGAHCHRIQPSETLFLNGYEKRFSESIPADFCFSTADRRPRKAYVVYSLGNFLSTMITFPCKLGVLRSLHLSRNNSGDCEWYLGDSTLVWNQIEGKRCLAALPLNAAERMELDFWNDKRERKLNKTLDRLGLSPY